MTSPDRGSPMSRAGEVDVRDPCPTCQDNDAVFYETALAMVPCPTCRPDEHERKLRRGF